MYGNNVTVLFVRKVRTILDSITALPQSYASPFIPTREFFVVITLKINLSFNSAILRKYPMHAFLTFFGNTTTTAVGESFNFSKKIFEDFF